MLSRYSAKHVEALLDLFRDQQRFDETPVESFVNALVQSAV
jgi:hypothetical protein